jgi:hypothetical protein
VHNLTGAALKVIATNCPRLQKIEFTVAEHIDVNHDLWKSFTLILESCQDLQEVRLSCALELKTVLQNTRPDVQFPGEITAHDHYQVWKKDFLLDA